MEKVREMVHKALRDDNTTTVGLRTLLGHSADPYGVFFHHFPEAPDFTSKSYLTHYLVAVTPEETGDTVAVRLRQAVMSVTAWSANPLTVERALRRAENVLQDLRKVTLPSSQAEVHACKLEGEGPDLWDGQFKAHYRAASFRVWYRDDVTN